MHPTAGRTCTQNLDTLCAQTTLISPITVTLNIIVKGGYWNCSHRRRSARSPVRIPGVATFYLLGKKTSIKV